jgi:hypothetical protein
VTPNGIPSTPKRKVQPIVFHPLSAESVFLYLLSKFFLTDALRPEAGVNLSHLIYSGADNALWQEAEAP